jgi:3-phenylpropionate/trans-cinnamate dioxygenase ferredoxin component
VPELRRVASISDLREGEVSLIEVDGRSLAVFLTGGRPVVTDEECPHAGCPLSEFGVIEGNEIECSCHGSRFDVSTGAVLAPPATDPLTIYPVEVRGEDVMVDIG